MDERNNCTVHALAKSAGIELEQAYQLLKAYGRKDNHGFNMYDFLTTFGYGKAVFTCWSVEWLQMRRAQRKQPHISLKEMRKMFPMGHYVFGVHVHVVAYVNGQVYDNIERAIPKYRITRILEIDIPAVRNAIERIYSSQSNNMAHKMAAKGEVKK